MKAVIFAGGFGTRISEESAVRPKPMVEIGDRPILWHIMKIYAAGGVTEFVILAGYKGNVIREFFANYTLHASDVTFDLRTGATEVHGREVEPWRVTVLDTGLDALTGGRLLRARAHLTETFFLTYGDCVGAIDADALLAEHRSSGALVTLTAVQPPGRFGALHLEPSNRVTAFHEKPHGDGGWINGGFFVVEPEALDRIPDETTAWEASPLESLARDGLLHAYLHDGYWQNLDTLRDKNILEQQWASGSPGWKIW